jgi:hypothetical protein
MSRAGLVVITSSVVLLALVATNPNAVAYGAPVSVVSSSVTESTSGSPAGRWATPVSTRSFDNEDLEPRFLDFLGDVVKGATEVVNTADKIKNTVNTVTNTANTVKNTVNTVENAANSLAGNGRRPPPPPPPTVKKPVHHRRHHHRRPHHHHHRRKKQPTKPVLPPGIFGKLSSLKPHPGHLPYRTTPIVPPSKVVGGKGTPNAGVLGEKKPTPPAANVKSATVPKPNASAAQAGSPTVNAPPAAAPPKAVKPAVGSTSTPGKTSK